MLKWFKKKLHIHKWEYHTEIYKVSLDITFSSTYTKYRYCKKCKKVEEESYIRNKNPWEKSCKELSNIEEMQTNSIQQQLR